MRHEEIAARREKAQTYRAGLRLAVPPPRVEADKRRKPRSQERQQVRRLWAAESE